MKYFYEYKIKNGAKVGGHNLEDIMITDKGIFLSGFDIINTIYSNEYNYWRTLLKHNEIEYIKITPMRIKKMRKTFKSNDEYFKFINKYRNSLYVEKLIIKNSHILLLYKIML